MSHATTFTSFALLGLLGVGAAGCGSASHSTPLTTTTSTTPPSSPSGPSAPPPPPPPPPPSSGGSSGGSSSGGGSGGGSTVSEKATGEFVLEASIAPLTVTEVALRAALCSIDPVTFSPPIGPTLAASGTPDAGSVTVDFGAGSIFNKLTCTGALTVSWTRSGPTAWSLTVTFDGFGTDSLLGGTSLLDGSLTLAVSVAGTTVAASLSGSVTKTSSSLLFGSSTTTITPSLTYGFDTATGASVLDGSLAIVTEDAGGWSGEARALTFRDGAVQSGAFLCDRTSFPALGVTFTFTAPDQGTFLIRPLLIPGTFSL